ncbi:MAG TPA: tetratricopeptide repeat protein [Pirellulaceae bacterium]|nr:tetratricopeptide repeat protein [Pirellulaceae bacterium]
MTLLRCPWEWGLMQVLGEPDEPTETAEATAEHLSRTSLLEQVEVLRNAPGGGRQLVSEYTLHPATAEFAATRQGADAAQIRAAHRRIGDWLEAEAARSPYFEINLEAGHHLFAAGEYDRSEGLLGPASQWLGEHGRVREGLRVLEPLLTEPVRKSLAPERVGRLLDTVGIAYFALGQVEKATEYYEKSIMIACEIGDRLGEGSALGNLGIAYAALGQVRTAIGYYEQQLVISREIGDRCGEGCALGNLGIAYADLGEVAKAIGYYEQRIMISREISDRRGEGNALGNLGRAYADLGQVEKAIGCYEKRFVIAREIGDRRGEGNALGNLGLAYADLGQVEKAIRYYEQQLVIVREIGDRRGEGRALGNLGLAYAALGQVEKAKGYWRTALGIGHEIKDPQIVRVFSQQLQNHGD